MSLSSFQSPRFAPDMARILPFVGNTFAFSQLGSGASDVGTMTPPPTNSLLISGGWFNRTVWTAGGGDTTGLTVELGDAGDPNELLVAGDVVALAASVWSTLGAVPTKYGQFTLEATAYAPIVTFTPTGGSTELDHIDAGEGVMAMFYARLPDGAKLWALCDAATF